MRVLFDGVQAGNRSGTGVYVQEIARHLAVMDDLELHLLWPEGTPAPSVPPENVSPVPPGALARILWQQWTVPALANHLNCDLTHYTASVGSLRQGPANVLTVHDISFVHAPEWFRKERALYYRAVVRRSARNASRIIAVSQATAHDLEEHWDIDAAKIDVVHNGVDERFQPVPEGERRRVRERYRLPGNFVLCVATLEPRKNLARLIEAWAGLAREFPHDLVLAGRDGWKTGPIRAAAAASGFAERIHFPGHVDHDDLPALLSAAAVFAYPSLYEGFGIPVIEAMACGVPVVTSTVSSLPEVAGDAATLVEPLEVEAIAHGLRRVLADAELQAVLSAKGLERAKAFHWRKSAEGVAATYRKVRST
ncbi:MAG: glycosyltransferase family 4 protein [Candidatus Hydrogenedentes bacterium]|nr:glycosyltransferase family 4 protein [Candidatus Hydrogenedentota bacterium]